MKEWQTFIRKFSDMKEGRHELFIKDLTEGPRKYDTSHVIANVARKKDNLNNPEILWFRSESGIKYPEPWYMTIEREMEAYIPGKPWHDVFEALAIAEKARN